MQMQVLALPWSHHLLRSPSQRLLLPRCHLTPWRSVRARAQQQQQQQQQSLLASRQLLQPVNAGASWTLKRLRLQQVMLCVTALATAAPAVAVLRTRLLRAVCRALPKLQTPRQLTRRAMLQTQQTLFLAAAPQSNTKQLLLLLLPRAHSATLLT
jgi:hypothetical protein